MGLIKDKFKEKPEGTTPGGRSISIDGKRGTNNVIPKGERPPAPGRSIDDTRVLKCSSYLVGDLHKDDVEEKEDVVNHPKHYKIEGISEEVIDICEAMIKDITKETGNPVLASHIAVVMQYVMRAHKKNGKEDYKKAIWYLNRAIDSMEGE